MAYIFDTTDNEKWKAKCITEMDSCVSDLVEYLKEYGIEFYSKDGTFENVVFRQDNKICKIAWQCFYRFSGLCCVQSGNVRNKKTKSKNESELMYVTRDMFISVYIRSFLENFFNIK